ncbi:hypothetical protein [Effusibacillus consociatus]|uniref:Uncharacterized protein n=1 Tax=Effusibacillus consociatus TaxID=1117041 RepID=A0ABV9Q2I3_9BACL
MHPIQQLLQMAEGQKQNMEHFVEHMGVILNNVEDNLTKELLSHLVEEEHERLATVNNLIESLRQWNSGDDHAPSASNDESFRSAGRDKKLTVGSLIGY